MSTFGALGEIEIFPLGPVRTWFCLEGWTEFLFFQEFFSEISESFRMVVLGHGEVFFGLSSIRTRFGQICHFASNILLSSV